MQLQTRWCHKRHEREHEPWAVNINEKRLNSIRVALTPAQFQPQLHMQAEASLSWMWVGVCCKRLIEFFALS